MSATLGFVVLDAPHLVINLGDRIFEMDRQATRQEICHLNGVLTLRVPKHNEVAASSSPRLVTTTFELEQSGLGPRRVRLPDQ